MVLFKEEHRKNLAACAIELMKMVGADLHIRPNALRLHNQYIHPSRLW